MPWEGGNPAGMPIFIRYRTRGLIVGRSLARIHFFRFAQFH